MSLALSTAGTSSRATTAHSKDDPVVQRFYNLIDQEKAAPLRLKEFATQLQTFFAASNALNIYLENPEISPEDDVEILMNISEECRHCVERCQTFLMTFLNELGTSAGGIPRSSSQLYRIWAIDSAFILRENMETLTAAINLHLSPRHNSGETAIEMVPKFLPLAAINTVTPSNSTQHGSAGMLFKSCADLFSALTKEACFLVQLQEKQRLAFREIFGKFYLGGTGFLAEQGELDKTLDVSARLKDQTISLLVQIAKILCSEETGFFQAIDKASIDGTLSNQRQRLLSILDSFETNAYQTEYSDTDSLISEDSDTVFSIETILDELGTFVGCLTKLGFSLDRPAPDPALAPNKAHTPTPSPSLISSATETQTLGKKLAPRIVPTLRHNPMVIFEESKDALEDDGDCYQNEMMSDKKADLEAPARSYYNSSSFGKRIHQPPFNHRGSFGFSLSDIKLAFGLGKLIYYTCFTKEHRDSFPPTDARYFEFGKDIQTLAHSLEQLIEVTENASKQQKAGIQRQPRPLQPWVHDERQGFEAELKSLREVTGDFCLTIRDCDSLLLNPRKFHRDQAGFVDTVFWHASTESEISNLKERVRLHITKLSFVIKPFEIQLLVGIRNELIRLQQDVRDLAGLMITLSRDTTRDTALPSLPSIEMLLIPDVITQRFVAALELNRTDAFHDISDFPLKEGFDALVFHFAKTTVLFNPGVGLNQKFSKETHYLNLLKAKWILEKLKASSELAAAAKTDSLWLNCVGEVQLGVMEQCRRFETGQLLPPPLEKITQLPDDCFTIWIFESPFIKPPVLDERILYLTSPNDAALAVFRASDDDFRVATTIIPKEGGVAKQESYSVNMQSARLVPAYAILKGTASSPRGYQIIVHQMQHLSHEHHLKDLIDVFSFQQALTGYRVYFDTSNVSWSLEGSKKPGKCGMARVQLWEAKRLSKVPIAEDSDQSSLSSVYSSTPSPQTLSKNGFGQRRLTGLSSTITSSSRTSQIAGNQACNATVVHPPEPPVLIIYTLCDGKFTFLHLTLGDEIFVKESACSCKKSPTTCLRIVLSTTKKRIELRKLCASEPGPQGLHSWDLARFRIPRHPRYKDIEVVEKDYLCLDFQTIAAKTEFRDELRSLFEYVRDPDIQEYRLEIKHREINRQRTGLRHFSKTAQ